MIDEETVLIQFAKHTLGPEVLKIGILVVV